MIKMRMRLDGTSQIKRISDDGIRMTRINSAEEIKIKTRIRLLMQGAIGMVRMAIGN